MTLVQMSDLSLHLLLAKPKTTTKLLWSRQESLAMISQVEVLQQELEDTAGRVANSLNYVKTWSQQTSIADVPARIIARYTENIQ